jgi:hypothetical protein
MEFLLKIERYSFNPDWTIGRFLLHNRPVGFTIEDEIRSIKVKGETAIPFGEYELSFRQSPKFSDAFWWSDSQKILIPKEQLSSYKHIKDLRPHDLVWIKNVPDFEYILFHWGNFDDDTDGCVIGGAAIGFAKNRKGEMKECVLNSRAFYKLTYRLIYPLIKKGGQKILITKAK